MEESQKEYVNDMIEEAEVLADTDIIITNDEQLIITEDFQVVTRRRPHE